MVAPSRIEKVRFWRIGLSVLLLGWALRTTKCVFDCVIGLVPIMRACWDGITRASGPCSFTLGDK